MSLTEEEAVSKWCPFARQPTVLGDTVSTDDPTVVKVHHYGIAANREFTTGRPYDGCRCIASTCMMWNQHPPKRGKELERISMEKQKSKPQGKGWSHERSYIPAHSDYWVRHEQIPTGDCGLKSQESYCGYDQ